MKLTIAIALFLVSLAACAADEEVDPEINTNASELDYPTWGTCRGRCTEKTGYVKDMDGNWAPYTTYRCVDHLFSAVQPGSRIPEVSCSKVAQCMADGLCSGAPAIRPKEQGFMPPDPALRALDGYGRVWLRAKVEITSPKQYFLSHEWHATTQTVSTYTATQPPETPSVLAALDNQHTCAEKVEHVHGLASCAARAPATACSLRYPDRGAVQSETQLRCWNDRQVDQPRQWFHVTGDYPENAPEGQWNYNFDGTGCAFAIAGIVGSIAGALGTEGASAAAFAFIGAAGSFPSASACVPNVASPTQLDHFIPGATFGGPLQFASMAMDQTQVDIVGEVCQRSIGYSWVNTKEVKLSTWERQFGPKDGWGLAAGALSRRRYPSGGKITIRGTEPCRCAVPGDPDSIGLDCTKLTAKQHVSAPWLVTDNSVVAGHCDYRGCDCNPQQDPRVYTGALGPAPVCGGNF